MSIQTVNRVVVASTLTSVEVLLSEHLKKIAEIVLKEIPNDVKADKGVLIHGATTWYQEIQAEGYTKSDLACKTTVSLHYPGIDGTIIKADIEVKAVDMLKPMKASFELGHREDPSVFVKKILKSVEEATR